MDASTSPSAAAAAACSSASWPAAFAASPLYPQTIPPLQQPTTAAAAFYRHIQPHAAATYPTDACAAYQASAAMGTFIPVSLSTAAGTFPPAALRGGYPSTTPVNFIGNSGFHVHPNHNHNHHQQHIPQLPALESLSVSQASGGVASVNNSGSGAVVLHAAGSAGGGLGHAAAAITEMPPTDSESHLTNQVVYQAAITSQVQTFLLSRRKMCQSINSIVYCH